MGSVIKTVIGEKRAAIVTAPAGDARNIGRTAG